MIHGQTLDPRNPDARIQRVGASETSFCARAPRPWASAVAPSPSSSAKMMRRPFVMDSTLIQASGVQRWGEEQAPGGPGGHQQRLGLFTAQAEWEAACSQEQRLSAESCKVWGAQLPTQPALLQMQRLETEERPIGTSELATACIFWLRLRTTTRGSLARPSKH